MRTDKQAQKRRSVQVFTLTILSVLRRRRLAVHGSAARVSARCVRVAQRHGVAAARIRKGSRSGAGQCEKALRCCGGRGEGRQARAPCVRCVECSVVCVTYSSNRSRLLTLLMYTTRVYFVLNILFYDQPAHVHSAARSAGKSDYYLFRKERGSGS